MVGRSDRALAYRTFPGQIAYVWHAGLHSTVVQQSLESQGFTARPQIIWVKQHFVLSRRRAMPDDDKLGGGNSYTVRYRKPPKGTRFIIAVESRSTRSWQGFTGKDARHAATGNTFTEIAVHRGDHDG
jgi:hypothetical protein